METRTRWVDGMKGIAISGILMIHSGGGGLPGLLGDVGNIGKNGVQVFFLISGYLTFLSLNRACNGKINREKAGKWLLGRLTKLMPLYYLFCILGILSGPKTFWLGNETGISAGNVLAHLFLVSGFFPQYCNSIVGIEWYIGALVIFYLFAPVLYKVIDTKKKAVTAWILCAFLCAWVSRTACQYFAVRNAPEVFSLYFSEYSIVVQLPVLMLGAVLFFVRKPEGDTQDGETIITSYALFLFSVIMIGGMAICESSLFGLSRSALFGVWFFILAYSQSMHTAGLIGNPVFRYLGRYSYPIYWTHIWFIAFYEQWVHFPISSTVAAWAVKFTIVLTASALTAPVLTECVEKPILRACAALAEKCGRSDR